MIILSHDKLNPAARDRPLGSVPRIVGASTSRRSPPPVAAVPEGWHGWETYAPFYDWENARTVQRRDVGFWQRLATRVGGPVLELGCGTGRVSLPVAKATNLLVGIDRSAEMLARAGRRLRRSRYGSRVRLVRGDIRALPFLAARPFQLAIAPYGILQSLLRDRDLAATLRSVSAALAIGGTFGIDLVPDLAAWAEYENRVSLTGRRSPKGSHLTLIESVRQDPARRLTIFDQRYIERRGAARSERRFSLTFRTMSVRQMTHRLERAGFRVETILGDYRGGPWDARAEVWIVLATKRR